MSALEMIDFHTHIFPGKIAARAMDSLSQASGHMIPVSDGTREGLLQLMDADGVSQSVVLSIATNEGQMTKVNDHAIAINGGRLVSFGSVYPRAENAVDELHRLHDAGVKGIKLHPEYQDFFVDDDALLPIYETLRALKMITVFHAGMDNAYMEPIKASPKRLAAMLPAFGEAPVVLAHMGGYIMWREVLEVLAGKPVYLDTSFCFSRIPLPLCKAIVTKHGPDHILFGSDAPWSRPANERRLVDALELSDADTAAVLRGNARRLLAL